MSAFKILGGQKLEGSIKPQGAKNEALQAICASLMTAGTVRISNIPNITDVNILIEIISGLGCRVVQIDPHTYEFNTPAIDESFLNTEEYRKKAARLRGSVTLLAPLLTRCGNASIPKPGGDRIGRRKMDIHFNGFQQLGCQFDYQEKTNLYHIAAKRIKGTEITLEEASVTGTANLIMATVLAEGKTTIYNAACEPYIQQLCLMLNRMGAKITGIKSNLLKIEGVKSLSGTTHELLPDMIEIGSFIGMAAITQSAITIENCRIDMLGPIPNAFRKMGIHLEYQEDNIYVPAQKHYRIVNNIDKSIPTIADAPWPGLTPDLLSIILITATQAEGSILIHQKMFESRLFFVDKIIDMGAQIILCDPHRAIVIGLNQTRRLRAINMTSPDIRAGIALVLAALSADGESTILNIEQIERGYQNIESRLQKIGAHISRIN